MTSGKGSPRPPDHLSKAAASWWREMASTFALDEEPHSVKLLTIAAEALDRREGARQVISREGAFVTDRWGQPREHPAVRVERDAAVLFARCCRELALPIGDADAARPPRIGTGARS